MLGAFAAMLFLAWILSREDSAGEVVVSDYDPDDPGEDVDDA